MVCYAFVEMSEYKYYLLFHCVTLTVATSNEFDEEQKFEHC